MHTLHQKIHHRLKLQHHKHTGRVLHHHHTSYRALAVLFMVATVVMIGITIAGHVTADSFMTIQGTEPTAIPTAPARIATPTDGATLTSNSTLVTGSCPVVSPQVVVIVSVDRVNVGSAACDGNNDFSLPVTLSAGAHTVTTQTYTIASQRGPGSDTVHITSPAGNAVPFTASPITLTADAPFVYLGADKTAVWTGTIVGGTPPYHVHIDWNDGNQTNITTTTGKQYFSHDYVSLSGYDPLFSVTDSGGNAVSEQFAVAAYTTASPASDSATPGSVPSGLAVMPRTLFGLYGILLTTISVCGIIWLEAKHAARHEIALS